VGHKGLLHGFCAVHRLRLVQDDAAEELRACARIDFELSVHARS
jgi:hypothetical protein